MATFSVICDFARNWQHSPVSTSMLMRFGAKLGTEVSVKSPPKPCIFLSFQLFKLVKSV